METYVPFMEVSSLTEDIHFKTQNTDLDMQDFLRINNALQTKHYELVNNTAKLIDIDMRIKKDSKKLREVEDDPIYFEEQRQLYGYSLENLNTDQQTRLEILPQNQINLRRQNVPTKQTIGKVLDEDERLAE